MIKYRVRLSKSADYKDVLAYEDLRVGSIFKGEGKIWKVTKVYADGSLQVEEKS